MLFLIQLVSYSHSVSPESGTPPMRRFLLSNEGEFGDYVTETSIAQSEMDLQALQMQYNTDLAQKLFPMLYTGQASEHILELHNSAKYAQQNIKQQHRFMVVALMCFMEPNTAGCENFNSNGDCADGDCTSFGVKRKQELASFCLDRDTGRVDTQCFIVGLRDSDDGGSRDDVIPWNADVQKWFDDHNCTSLAYHLRYRCNYNLMKWDAVKAVEKWVDVDNLFDSVFGLNAVASFNDRKPLECSSLSTFDQKMLFDTALLHADTARMSFVAASMMLAKFGAGAADALFRQQNTNAIDTVVTDLVRKLRTVILVNLFYDGAVQPLREIACALNACIDYHPMHTVVDKNLAFEVFYPGGLSPLLTKAAPYAVAQHNGTLHPATSVAQVPMDT